MLKFMVDNFTNFKLSTILYYYLYAVIPQAMEVFFSFLSRRIIAVESLDNDRPRVILNDFLEYVSFYYQ